MVADINALVVFDDVKELFKFEMFRVKTYFRSEKFGEEQACRTILRWRLNEKLSMRREHTNDQSATGAMTYYGKKTTAAI